MVHVLGFFEIQRLNQTKNNYHGVHGWSFVVFGIHLFTCPLSSEFLKGVYFQGLMYLSDKIIFSDSSTSLFYGTRSQSSLFFDTLVLRLCS